MKSINVSLLWLTILVTMATASENNISMPIPKNKMNTNATAIYCDSIVNAYLRDSIDDKNTLNAYINDKSLDHYVIIISDGTLYIHNRNDFDKGELSWGESKPLKILKNDPKQEIIAVGYNTAPVSSNVIIFSLNRSTGVGVFVEQTTPVGLQSETKIPCSYSMYLSCGVRKK
jgi:hypothetical protein